MYTHPHFSQFTPFERAGRIGERGASMVVTTLPLR
jgi:hypothetical protein